MADDVFKKRTVEGYLASLLIYHQLCEEMIKVLIDCSNFLIQCSIFPQELTPKNLKGKMFGQLVFELESGIINDDIKRFVAKCCELNKLRIRMVHKITLKTSIEDISNQTEKVKKIFDAIWKLFDNIYDNYRVAFKDYKKDIEEFEETLNEMQHS